MLSSLYSEKITIRTITGGNPAEGYTYVSPNPVIDGAIFLKSRRNEQQDGTIIMTENVLNTNSQLDISKTLITYEGRDRKIVDNIRCYDHFTGKLDHWEYNF